LAFLDSRSDYTAPAILTIIVTDQTLVQVVQKI
jgi:hypothetical protein